jgi:hypothetical protein
LHQTLEKEKITQNKTKLEDYKNIHTNDIIVVCGCGDSLNYFKNVNKNITFGVNDVGRKFDPTYLVVVNPESGFKDDRYYYVENSKAKTVFSHYDLNFPHTCNVKFHLGKPGGTCCDDGKVPYSSNSPYIAMVLAGYMGARKIGIVGVDLTDNHFFAKTGVHPLLKNLHRMNEHFGKLGEYLLSRGIEVVNLSEQSLLTPFKKIKEEDLI